MTWVDRTVTAIEERFSQKIGRAEALTIRDEKTLSGRVHVGSLRGVAIHGMIAQVLTEKGIPCEFLFELNDFDPMDELPAGFDQTFRQYMGQPLHTVPSHVQGMRNYPTVFGEEFVGVISHLGFHVETYALAPQYKEGKFDETIREALDAASLIRAIYREVSGSQKPEDWYPLQVICERCGKIGTTQVTSWNPHASSGQAGLLPGLVTYECKKNLVQWAEGCGHTGEISPFRGAAKLPWKVEWPAKWKVFQVDIEGAGKDHSAAGGSRAIGARITKEVFHYPEPFDIPYEFFNIGGKKMSASKGLGASAKEIADLLPPKLVKLLMIRKVPSNPIDFDPAGDTIPLLFDEYDRLADHFFGRHPSPDPELQRTYALCQIDFPTPPEDTTHVRFSLAAFIAQMPHLDARTEAEKMKGSALTEAEKVDLAERILYAKKWVDVYAPEKYVFKLSDGRSGRFDCSDEEKTALSALEKKLRTIEWTGSAIHEAVHNVKEELALSPKIIFQPLYRMFLGRTDGPQVGWFLSTIEKEQVLKQLQIALLK